MDVRAFFTCVAVVGALATAQAAPLANVEFDGAPYEKAFESRQQVEPLVEFTQPGETVNRWTKLLTFHWYRESSLLPDEAARRLATHAKARSESANARTSVNEDSTEATVDFMAFEAGSDTVEVNAFKYGLAADGRGLVAVQFAFRFTLGETDPGEVKAARQRAVTAIRTFDLGQVRDGLQR